MDLYKMSNLYRGPSIDASYQVLVHSSSLAKGYDPLYSSSPLASLDGFSRSHGLYVMQLVVAATNQEKCQQNKNACPYKIMFEIKALAYH